MKANPKDKKTGAGSKEPTLEESVPLLKSVEIPEELVTMEDLIVDK